MPSVSALPQNTNPKVICKQVILGSESSGGNWVPTHRLLDHMLWRKRLG